MRKIIKNTIVCLLIISMIATTIPLLIPSVSASDNWTLTIDDRGLKGYPNLQESVWEKNANMAPNGPYDKIGLHRLVQAGITPKDVVFINPGTYGYGAALTSNPATDSFTKTENESQAIYWANRGFDVYAIDYRTHFVPASLNTSQLGFMANWGWDQWISDIKEAVDKAKDTSCVSSVFMAGQSFGGRATTNYATVYGQDVKGIIMLDGGNASANPAPTNSYNLTAALLQENATSNWALIAPNLPGRTPVAPTFQSLMQYALANPSAPAEAPPGTPLPPVLNPLTNKSWSNITQWCAFVLNGATTNLLGGYSNVSNVIAILAGMDRYWPDRLNLEANAINDWKNCPYVTNDFDEHYKSLNVPLIGFTSELYGLDRFGPIGNISNPDVTRIFLKGYGHIDVFSGTYSARDVSEPVYQWMVNHSPSSWTLVTNGRAVKAYSDLREYVWQKNASLAPNGVFDKIALHRLVMPGTSPKGVIFINPGAWGSGEQIISNPTDSNFTNNENSSQPIYWANRGFDVYSIDYRSHFVPANSTTSQLAFMLNWGWDQWISDTKEAVEKTKQISGATKIFMAGISMGGETTMDYASLYGKTDLSGIILLDPTFNGTQGNPIVTKLGGETNTYNLTKALSALNQTGAWSYEAFSTWGVLPSGAVFIEKYALENPNAPAEYPPGTPLQPTINPMTNKTWTNITEWNAYKIYTVFKGQAGAFANNFGGYSNTTLVAQKISAADRFWPTRMIVEGYTFRDWINCPYVTYDFDDHYKEINVPLLAFASELYQNRTGTFRFINGINTSDFTGIYLPKYSHTDVIMGTYSVRDVSQPTLDWMINRLPTHVFTLGNTNVGTYQDGNDANAKSASYFTCNYTGTITDIFAYIASTGASGISGAAIYSDNNGSPGALIAATDKATVSTAFSWVDFHLASPVSVTAGTGYWLAISSNNGLNIKVMVGSGVRVHNGVSSWFSDPFGPVWGTDDTGSMSIYAKGTSNTSPTLGNTNVGTYQDGNDANAKSASYFTCNYTGTITDIFAYVASAVNAGISGAAIYADNGGSPGALVAATNKVTVGTAFSWVDFHLVSPVSVTTGTGYWLAISSDNALNMKIVASSGVRVHNGVSSWFSDPFGPVWGTDDKGSMSIYAKGT